MIRLMIPICCLLLFSCSPRISPSYNRLLQDSVLIVNSYRDTNIIIPSDSSHVEALLDCDSLGKIRIKEIRRLNNGKNIQPSRIAIKDNVLSVTTVVDSFLVYAKLKDRYEKVLSRSSESEVVVKDVNRLHGWQKLLMSLGVLLIIILAIKIYRKIKL